MMREKDFQYVISKWMASDLPSLVKRNVRLPIKTKPIVSIIGPRRAGKTYIMYQTIKALLENVSKNNILYIDFENERLRNLDANDMRDMLKVFYMLFNPVENEHIYLFLDEIHVVRDWDKWVRRIHDAGKYHIYISGSSSKLLSEEISTTLRGRSIDYVILPFSYTEFLHTRNYHIENVDILGYMEERGRILGLLNEYIEFGGYPEIVLEKDKNIKLRLLRSYYNAIFYRDIIERYSVKSPSLLDTFLRYCLTNHSKYISVSKAYNYIKTLGYKVGKATLIDYLKYAEEAFLLFPVEIYSYFIKDRKQYPRKIYAVDPGIIKALEIDTNMGRLMENIVYIELLRRRLSKHPFQIYYWRDKLQKEVDFLIKRGLNIEELIQVTYASSIDEVSRREIRGLLKAGQELKCRSLRIITWDYEDKRIFDGERIWFTPLWKWLLYE